MKALILAAMILAGAIGIEAQKKSTIMGDVAIGELLWTSVAPVFRSSNTEVSPKTNDLVIAELEKRMKARGS